MRFVIYIAALFLVFSCSDEHKRKKLLSSADELAVAWTQLEERSVAEVDSVRVVCERSKADSNGHYGWTGMQALITQSDSVLKGYREKLHVLESSFLISENALRMIKQAKHAFASWKVLMGNNDIEMKTAQLDLNAHRKNLDSLSANFSTCIRTGMNAVEDMRGFIQSLRLQLQPDSLNNTP